MERLGVSAIIIEDKMGSKRNSLFKDNTQLQSSIEDFSLKISEAKKIQHTNMSIVARIESLNLGKGMDDACDRAEAYIHAGADGIMIHSNKETPSDVFEFCKRYNRFKIRKPLVVVPSTFNQTREKDFLEHGVNVVIYANHLLRSAYPAMLNTASLILKYERSYEADNDMLPIQNIIELIPGGTEL